jgi:ABC-type multidrug transport system ATPase subunit
MPLAMFPMMSQAIIMLGVSVNRIRDFLILPQLKRMEEKENYDECDVNSLSDNVVISIKNGRFKWGPPPEIPLSQAEKQKIELEKKKREKEAKEKLKELNNNKSQSVFNSLDSEKEQKNSSSVIPDNITNVSVKHPPVEDSVKEDINLSTSKSTSVVTPTPSLSPFSSVSPSSNKNRATLNNINLKIKKGELTMIIGLFLI